MNLDDEIENKLKPRCICCLCLDVQKFSFENMTRVIQDLLHAELPPSFKYVPTIFCVDCVSYLDEFKKFKATVQTSFVKLEKMVHESGLNKLDCLEKLELIPKLTPDPSCVIIPVEKPIKRLWKCAGRPRKDGTPAQPRYYKSKFKATPIYDTDSYKSKSSDDENYCRRSDNEEWNPDQKNLNVNKKEKTKKSGGKRGRPRKNVSVKAEEQVLKEIKGDKKELQHNGLLSKNGNISDSNLFAKRPRGRPPKSSEISETTQPISSKQNSTTAAKKKVLQKLHLNDSNLSTIKTARSINHFETLKKGRGRPRKDPLLAKLKYVVNNQKKPTKSMLIMNSTSIIKRKRGRPPKTVLSNSLNSKKTELIKTYRNHKTLSVNFDTSGWATETDDEIKVKMEDFGSEEEVQN